MDLKNSERLYSKSLKVIAGGVNSGIRQTEWPVPLFFKEAKGSHMWDVDGNDYIDYVMGMGPNLFGHAPQFIIDQVSKDIKDGFVFTGQFEQELALSEMIVNSLPYEFVLRFASSGTEIDQLAIRTARAYTGRTKFVKFEGHYHGWMDSLLYNVHPPVQNEGSNNYSPIGESSGMSQGLKEEVIISEWNNLEHLRKIFQEEGSDISCVIMEPILANTNVIMPEKGYLESVRDLCDEYGALLIFDEVITGFRVALGGAQEITNVRPDIATYAKALAGGFPIAMMAASKKIMDLLANGQVYHGGSFNSNVMSISAAYASISHILENKTQFYGKMNNLGNSLIEGLNDMASKAGVPVLIQGLGSVFWLSFTTAKSISNYREHALLTDDSKYEDFIRKMLKNGVRLSQNGRWHMSSAHTESDVDKTINAAYESFRDLS
jgi:glutamate-1-semialdehyde 2,1-aminomutase